MFDILFIAESKTDSTYSAAFCQPGFRLVRRDRKKGGGGLLVYIRADLSVYRRVKLEPEDVESICLDVKDANNSRFLVCGCYRSPGKCNELEFMASLSRAAELMYQTRKELVLLGDFNQDMYTNPVENRFPNKNLVDFCNRYCFENKITMPTRVTDRTKSLLDVILASHSERFICSGNLHLGLSDHDLVFIVRKHKIPRPNPRLVEYRSMKNFDHEKFLADLKNAPWGTAYCFSVVDDIWGHWSALYKNILDQQAPVNKKWIRGDQLPWISPKIQQEIGRRNRLFKRYRKNTTNDLWVAYKQQRNKVTSLKRKGIKEFCNNAISNAKHAGEFWKKMKPLLPNSSQSKLNGIILVEDGKILTEPSEVVEVFNNCFASVAVSETCSGSAENFYDHPSDLGIASRQVLEHPFNFEPLSSSYVKEILDN